MVTKPIVVKFDGKCQGCGGPIEAGQSALWSPSTKKVWHPTCSDLIPQSLTVATIVDEIKTVSSHKGVKSASLKPKPKLVSKPKSTVSHYTSNAYVDTPVIIPLTQKAKGIVTLQSAGMLSESFAIVAQTEETAVNAGIKMGIPCFVRPCPVTPRHGFVDSRVVKSAGEIRQVWLEARQADPEAELIVMPFVQADHNMVWRPGLLSVGPGHDGATAGHDSISVFLQPDYPQSWKNLSTQAGVKLETQDPFLEAVTGSAHSETVITQIRGGVKGTVTEPDWNPEPMVVGDVVIIDQATKNLPGKMLAWEMEAKLLKPGFHVVYNPGGNLGDHYTVHAQLAGVSVISSFVPKIGQSLPKLGIDLVPLEPQAIVFGFLGGLLAPSLKDNLGARQRAVCAAIMGTHHGMRMGGDAGVYIGASVAFMLRLGQAALWGEARHAGGHGHKLSRAQIYTDILDDWLKGREKLADKVALFHTHKWGGGYGGPPWAACGHATVDLDRSMFELIRLPSRVNAKKVLAELTNTINLAHNNGWWLNKFSTADWFDLAADLDPRVALMAGPVWYESTLVPAGPRMDLLTLIESMGPVDLGKWAGVAIKSKEVKSKHKPSTGNGTTVPQSADMGGSSGGHQSYHSPVYISKSKKLGGFASVEIGGSVPLSSVPLSALCKGDGGHLHTQLIMDDKGGYYSGEIINVPEGVTMAIDGFPTVPSASGSGVEYRLLPVTPTGIVIEGIVVLGWAPHKV